MPAYFNAFDKAKAGDEDAKKAFKDYNDAYQKAKALKKALEDAKNGGTAPDQNQIDEAKKALEEARKVIDKYATNTSRLSAAVLNDIAIQNSPAYKNVSADDASEAAKAAKDKYDEAVKKLHQALEKKMPKDQANGKDIPDTNTPDKDGKLDDKDYLKNIQAHAQGEPLDRDVDAILKEMNDAAAELNKFATKTDALLKSVNEDAATHQNPAFKNASQPSFQKANGSGADDDKNGKAKKAYDEYGAALNAAKDLLKNPAATQKDVDAALKTLNEKRAALDAYNTDTTKLKASVGEHGKEKQGDTAAKEGTVTSDAYRNASDPHFMKEEGGKLVPDTEKNKNAAAAKKTYDEALTKAQELLKKHDDKDTPQDAKPIQKEIDAALKALDDARTKLDDYKTDTTKLEAEAKKSTPETAPAVTENDFENTPEFQNAKAKTSNGQTNADVAAYQEALKKARDLVKAANPTDPDAKNSSHPTQKEINEALDALKAAKKQITDNYKTNLEALTAAKDFAGGDFKNTPEYKNAVALKDDNSATANQEKKTAAQNAVNALDDTVADSALKKAKDIIENPAGKTQKEVDEALKTLQDAMDKVTKEYKTDAKLLENEVGDKDEKGKDVIPPFESSVPYKNALEKAKTEEDKTGNDSATKKLEAYNEKLKAAQELLNKVNNPDLNAKPEDRPTQAQVDKALSDLKQAKKDIDDAFKTKVDDLKKETNELKDDGQPKDNKDKFENSTEFKNASAKKGADGKDIEDVQKYKDALKKANDLLGKFDENGKPKPGEKDIPTQQEVDEALDALQAAKKKITDGYKTNKSDLNTEAGKDSDFTKTPEFQNAAGSPEADAYKKALEDAKKVLGDKDATQAQVDDALKKLKQAKDDLTSKHKTDKNKLYQEKGNDPEFRKSIPFLIADGKDIAEYNKALNDANAVLADPNATQAQVDEALRKLQAIKQRILDFYNSLGSSSDDDSDGGSAGAHNANANANAANAVDKSMLHAEVNGALADIANGAGAAGAANGAKGTKGALVDASVIKEFNDALENARRVLADPNATQEQVEAATMRLRAARAALNAAKANKGSNLRGNMGVQTGVDSATLSAFAAVFVGLAGLGVSAKRRKHAR